MFPKALIIIFIQTAAWDVDGRLSNCRPPENPTEDHCGDNMCLCSTYVALCQNKRHQILSYIPTLPGGITHLYFSNNRLQNLTKETFKNVSSLSIKVLSLDNNTITNISDEAFSSFIKLETLCLNQNEDVNKSQLSKSLRRIQTSIKLELSLSRVGLTEDNVGWFIKSLESKIVKLSLSRNRIKVVNLTAFQHLTGLTYLDLSDNKIQQMSTDIGLASLIYLNINMNDFAPETPFFCSSADGTPLFPSLANLTMVENGITTLDNDSFKCLSQLRSLGLSRNKIIKLNNNIFSGLHNLKVLTLAKSRISDIEPYALNNSKLENLNFRENNLFVSPKRHLHLFQLTTNLKYLDISLNNLKELTNIEIMTLLSNLTRLETLKATRINIKTIPEGMLDVFQNLTKINLVGNKIVKFPGLCNSVRNVTQFWLQSNKIRVLDKISLSDCFLGSIRELDLTDNPFSCTCENLWFRSAINDKGIMGHVYFKNWSTHYYCASPQDLKGTLFKDYLPTESSCNGNTYLLTVTVSLAAVLIVSSVTTVLGYKYRWYVKYWFYKHKSNKRSAEEEPLLERNFDAFMIYNPSDSQYVHHDIRLLLEEKHPYKLHIWERDITAGSDNIRGMVSGMDASRRAIAIVSKDSLDDGWFQFQLSVALDRQIELKQNFLILVLLENVECEGLSKYWCVLLTRLPTARWCHNTTDVKRAAFDQQIFNHLGSKNSN